MRHFCLPVLLTLVLFGLVGWGDYATGYDVNFGPLYAIPVAILTWKLNLRWGIGSCVLATTLWYYVDRLNRFPYVHSWHAWESAGTVLATTVVVAVGFNLYKKAVCQEKGVEKKIKGELSICACCKRIQESDGYWVELGTYLREHSEAQPRQKLCPDCARQQYVSGYSRTT